MSGKYPDWLQHNVPLQPLNTLALPATARYFTAVKTLTDLGQALLWAKAVGVDILPLGGGSNIVLAADFTGLVIQLQIAGRERLEQEGAKTDAVLVRAGAGENWHEFVLWTIEQDCFGLENLSLIPGSVGAAPIQNIGAYGVEIRDLFHSLDAINVHTGELVTFERADCGFGYRDSVFKGEARDRFIIVSVTFALSRKFASSLGYGQLHQAVLKAADGQRPTAALVSDVVCAIRSRKLPDPQVLGNAGSFFKNPLVTEADYRKLSEQEPGLLAYPAEDGFWKLAAGWLIECCGFKGVTRASGVGVYREQALVLVNHGGATGRDVLALAEEIKVAVLARFAVELEIEPRIYR